MPCRRGTKSRRTERTPRQERATLWRGLKQGCLAEPFKSPEGRAEIAMSPRIRSSLLLICSFAAGALALPIIVLSASALGWLPADAVSTPPMWESRLGQAVLKASLSHQAAGLSNPISGSDAELVAGMQAFKDGCAGCHGDASVVSHWGNSNFYPRVPQFAQNPPVLSAAEMFVAIKHGIRYSGMFANKKMKEEKIWPSWHSATISRSSGSGRYRGAASEPI